jgi:hypothetical protein
MFFICSQNGKESITESRGKDHSLNHRREPTGVAVVLAYAIPSNPGDMSMADEKSTGKRTLGVVESGDSISEDARAAAAEATVSEQIEVLKAEISRLKETAGLIAEGTGQLAVAKAESLREDIRQTIQANPLATLAGAAFIGYLFGLRHR